MAIKIPQLTFFCGPNTKQKRELAMLFAEKVMPPPLTNQMYCPLEEAAAALFFHDPLVPDEAFDKPPPGFHSPTIRGFMKEMADTLRLQYGNSALGRIALEQYRRGGWEEIFAHTIYTDVDHIHDIIPFVEYAGPENCLFINIGPLTKTFTWGSAKTIWLATPTVESQLAQLLRDLTPVRANEASNDAHTTRASDDHSTETETPPTH